MENASKALLIAGAILLVIALIAIGMSIFGIARDTVKKSEGQIDNMKVQMHNSQFTKYEGKAKKLDEIKELISTVGNNNSNATSQEYIVKFVLKMYTTPSKYGTYSYDYMLGGEFSDISVRYIKDFTTPGKDQYGSSNSQFPKGSMYDVKLKYNTMGIINIIELYRYQ